MEKGGKKLTTKQLKSPVFEVGKKLKDDSKKGQNFFKRVLEEHYIKFGWER